MIDSMLSLVESTGLACSLLFTLVAELRGSQNRELILFFWFSQPIFHRSSLILYYLILSLPSRCFTRGFPTKILYLLHPSHMPNPLYCLHFLCSYSSCQLCQPVKNMCIFWWNPSICVLA